MDTDHVTCSNMKVHEGVIANEVSLEAVWQHTFTTLPPHEIKPTSGLSGQPGSWPQASVFQMNKALRHSTDPNSFVPQAENQPVPIQIDAKPDTKKTLTIRAGVAGCVQCDGCEQR